MLGRRDQSLGLHSVALGRLAMESAGTADIELGILFDILLTQALAGSEICSRCSSVQL